VARHQSDIAVRIRSEIRTWVHQGKPDREILDSYKERYGAKVLIEPEGAAWWWIHLIPVFVLVSGAALVVLLVRKWATRPSSLRPRVRSTR
jgi:cytochrome c-type biogenesis protein CcmH/NrfF